MNPWEELENLKLERRLEEMSRQLAGLADADPAVRQSINNASVEIPKKISLIDVAKRHGLNLTQADLDADREETKLRAQETKLQAQKDAEILERYSRKNYNLRPEPKPAVTQEMIASAIRASAAIPARKKQR